MSEERKQGSGPKPGRVIDWNTHPEGPKTKMVSIRLEFEVIEMLQSIKNSGGKISDFTNEALREKWQRENK